MSSFLLPKEGDEDQFGEVRDEHSDEDSEGEEAVVSTRLTANVSPAYPLILRESVYLFRV